MEKPPGIFDRDREWRALSRFAAEVPHRPQLGIISGRRRQGKTLLLRDIVDASGGFYFGATQATAEEALTLFREAFDEYTGEHGAAFTSWDGAISHLFRRFEKTPTLIALDEFSYLVRAVPALPSIIQREIDRAVWKKIPISWLLCGSAMSIMGKILSGQAPLRGRANLEIVVQPFDYSAAARFWGIDDPAVAARVHSIVGGTAAYREFVGGDVPRDFDDFDDWVRRTVLEPNKPLCREARYLLDEESDIPDKALYHSLLAAIALGNNKASNISSYVGRGVELITHPLTVLEDCQLIRREPDVFRKNRPRYRIAEPLVTFYNAVMRPQWSLIESGGGDLVWRNAQSRFKSQVLGPHFEELCRRFAQFSDRFGELPGVVGAGVVADPKRKSQIEVDVAVFAPEEPGRSKKVLSLGEVKWNETMGKRHFARLARARDLLDARGYDVTDCVLACYSGKGFEEGTGDDRLTAAIGLDELYGK